MSISKEMNDTIFLGILIPFNLIMFIVGCILGIFGLMDKDLIVLIISVVLLFLGSIGFGFWITIYYCINKNLK